MQDNLKVVLEIAKPLIDHTVKISAEYISEKYEQPITSKMLEDIEENITQDLLIAFGNYILDSDTIVDIQVSMNRALCIDCVVIRDGIRYPFDTDLIIASGPIQCRHYRYIVKTNLRKLTYNAVAAYFANILKRRTLEKKVADTVFQITKNMNRELTEISTKMVMTDEEILAKNAMFINRSWETLNEYAKANFGTPEDFNQYIENLKSEEITTHRNRYNEKRRAAVEKYYNKKIEQAKSKLTK